MSARKFRWSKDYESAEEELLILFTNRGIVAKRWNADPYQDISPVITARRTRLWCAEGSLTVRIDNKDISLQPGDTLEISENTEYSITAGIAGCVCYQDE